jgi:glycosyltransferase involved in cell wall biosynthesis
MPHGYIMDRMHDLTLNCSRIGEAGGLRRFSEQTMACLTSQNHYLDVVLPESIPAPSRIHKISTPANLSSSSRVSKLRPIAWLAYSRFQFPVPRERRILCTTHHVLPSHKHQIVTVHDLRPYFYPDSSVQRFYFHRMLPKALKSCEGVLTVSETSRQMLIDVYGLQPSSVRVVPNAVTISPGKEISGPSPSMDPEYLLMVGATWAHKNADEVLRMHRHWAKRYRLKIVAGVGDYRSSLQSLSSELGISDRVDFLAGITDDQLQFLYSCCSALVYPSKMEGFGIPPLEAMAHGKPVIVSDIPTFRELYDVHPCYVRLGNEESWENAFRLIGEKELEYSARASAHAGKFSVRRMRDALHSSLRYFWGMGSNELHPSPI